MSGLEHVLNRAFTRIAQLEWRLSNLVRHGPADTVDAAAGTARLLFGEKDGKKYLSPPVPYSQTAGALKIHSPPTPGQQLTMICPNGDVSQGLILPMSWSNQNASPSQAGDANVMTYGGYTFSLKADVLDITGPKFNFTGDMKVTGNVDFEGGYVRSNGKAIDNTHEHTGVLAGAANTGPPA